jgi:16S rRNA (guanine966-N2)-methyltransferase
MKIISGKHRSRIIKYVKSATTRPTSNIVREGVFNMLINVTNLIVLDLFAGSGSYGLEALSRGAQYVYFNDINYKNTSLIKENLNSLKELEKANILTLDYQKALNYYKNNNIYFDLIFIDPPYFKGTYETVIPLIIDRLKDGGKIVIEINKGLEINLDYPNLEVSKDKIYGSKRIIVLSHTL